MDPNVAKTEAYERCADLPERAGETRLRPYEWHFLMALDGRKTAEEIGTGLRLDDARLAGVIHRLLEHKLMAVPEWTWKEFAARHPAASTPALPAPPPPPAAAPEAPAPAERTAAATPPPVTFAITRASAPGATPRTAPTPPATPPPPAATVAVVETSPAPAAEPALNLKQLIDYVTHHAGGGLRGKLAVYRLFLRVPNEQIRAAGIESLNFVDDRFEIREPAMRTAILDAVAAVTGRPYPLGT